MEIREIFIKACNEIHHSLNDQGFKSTQKGQLLKKSSLDKDLSFELYFQTSTKNGSSYIQILPHFSIQSKRLRKWCIEQTKNEYAGGVVYANQIGYVTPYNTWKEWNLAGLDYHRSIEEISILIINYVLPIFELFNDKQQAIEFLAQNGTQFNKWTKRSLLPLNFLICFSNKINAEKLFNDFIDNCTYKERVIKLYNELPAIENIDLNYAEFFLADKVKLAFVNGLNISSR